MVAIRTGSITYIDGINHTKHCVRIGTYEPNNSGGIDCDTLGAFVLCCQYVGKYDVNNFDGDAMTFENRKILSRKPPADWAGGSAGFTCTDETEII